MQRTLQTLTVGSRVFYPGHGVVSVLGIEDRTFAGDVQLYYVLALDLEPSTKLMLPVGKVKQARLRDLISVAKARALMKSVGQEPEVTEVSSDPTSRRLRATEYGEALRSGCAERYTATVRGLLPRFRSGKISDSEKQILQQALAMFVGEVSAVLDRPRDGVRADLRSVAELPATGW